MSNRGRRDDDDADERVLRHMAKAGEFDEDVQRLDERGRNRGAAFPSKPETRRKEMSFKGYSVPVCATLGDLIQHK